jgi:hypothetical protein
MNFTPPGADVLRAAILGVVVAFFPMADALFLSLTDEQLGLIEVFVVAVVTLGMFFYNPQRDG